jgi:hypothetical protein
MLKGLVSIRSKVGMPATREGILKPNFKKKDIFNHVDLILWLFLYADFIHLVYF